MTKTKIIEKHHHHHHFHTQPIVSKVKAIHHVLILDRSGSMASVREATRVGYNEQIQTIKSLAKTDNKEHYVTLVLFNHYIDTVVFNRKVTANSIHELQQEDYVPDGNTALNDAVAFTINRISNLYNPTEQARTNVFMTILTDGVENASTEYRDDYKLKRLVRQAQDDWNWTITYVGANHDVKEAVYNKGFNLGNSVSYSASSGGTDRLFDRLSSARMSYARGAGGQSVNSVNHLFSTSDTEALDITDEKANNNTTTTSK